MKISIEDKLHIALKKYGACRGSRSSIKRYINKGLKLKDIYEKIDGENLARLLVLIESKLGHYAGGRFKLYNIRYDTFYSPNRGDEIRKRLPFAKLKPLIVRLVKLHD